MMIPADQDPYRAGTIWSLGLDETLPVITPLIPATFCHVDAYDAAELAEVMAGVVLAEIQKRFETGRRCYAARVAGSIVAYGWVSFTDEFIGELNLRLQLLPGEAYIWNCTTLPDFRRRNLYSALLLYIVQELHKEHLSRVWIGADFDNFASQRGFARAGFTYVADLIIARVLTLRQIWAQAQPGVPDSLVADARRVFLNNLDTA